MKNCYAISGIKFFSGLPEKNQKSLMKELFTTVLLALLLDTVVAFASVDLYTIISYNVHIVVNENNIFDITETIDTRLNKQIYNIYTRISEIQLLSLNNSY